MDTQAIATSDDACSGTQRVPRTKPPKQVRMLPSASQMARLALAVFGSYAIASLVAVLPMALPVLTVSAIAWGRIMAVVVASFAFVAVYLFTSLYRAYVVMISIIIVLFGVCVVIVPNFLSLFTSTA